MKKISSFFAKLILSLAFLTAFTACAKIPGVGKTGGDEEEFVQAEKFVYSDTCVVTNVSKNGQEFTFQNLETGLRYTLSYDNLTFFFDRYGDSMTGSQLTGGQICNISFYREEKKLKSLEITSDYFSYSNVEGFRFYNSATRMEYLGDKYELDDNVVICSGRENIDVLEIADTDVLTLHGKDHVIYSITVDKGHGYLSLDNDKYFIEGFIEVGKDIRKITEEMLLTVPEGKYSVLISKDGTSAVREVTIGRNQEATIDLGDIEIKKNYGYISFMTEPSDAIIYLDGVKVKDTAKPVRVEYGIHELIVRADGYESISRYVSVGAPNADVKIKLNKLSDGSDTTDTSATDNDKTDENKDDDKNDTDKTDTDKDKDKDDNPDSPSVGDAPVPSDNPTDNNNDKPDTKPDDKPTENPDDGTGERAGVGKIYVEAPKGAELYLDGTLIGTVPISFDKKLGTMVITLKKAGCQTRSYTINVEETESDSNYSFSDLLALE